MLHLFLNSIVYTDFAYVRQTKMGTVLLFKGVSISDLGLLIAMKMNIKQEISPQMSRLIIL